MAELEQPVSGVAHPGPSTAGATPTWSPGSSWTRTSRTKTRDGVLEALDLLAALGYRSFDDPEFRWREFQRRGVVTAVRRREDWDWTSSGGAETARAGR